MVDFGEASNGLEAIEQLAVMQYDAMTLDLNMPDMHGLEVIQFVRQQSTYRHLPIVVLSTRTDAEMRRQVADAGANEYLVKPFAPAALLETVRALLAEPTR